MNGGGASAVLRLVTRAIRAGMAPGMVAGWLDPHDSNPRCVVAGAASVRPVAEEMTEDRWFDLASLTKVLVITPLVLIAFRNQDLSLETRVAQALPELDGTPLGERRIRHLLTHTSGLPAWAPLYAHGEGPDPGAAIRMLAGLRVGEVRGEVVYSCPGFILLGLILERLAGMPLDVLFDRLVLAPLSLANEIGFRPGPGSPLVSGARSPGAERALMIERGLEPDRIPETARGLPDDGNARFLGGVAGNAGLYGTIRGVLGLARAMHAPGALLTGEEIELATRNHTPGLGQARGLGWQLASSPGCSAGPSLSPGSYGHTGFTGTSLWIDPKRGLSMALLANRVHPGHRPTDLHPLRRRFHHLVVHAST